MAGRVQHSPNESPKKKEKRISALRFVEEVMAPKVRKVQKDEQGRHELYPTTAEKLKTTSDETMTGGSGILPQEEWKQRREAGTRQRYLPTRKE
jgi:hypothetical protein